MAKKEKDVLCLKTSNSTAITGLGRISSEDFQHSAGR
jgi:hypothetical protein